MRQESDESGFGAVTERTIGRTDPPAFMYPPLRTRALEQLKGTTELAAPKAIVIIAPVGYGKTVLMSMMLSELRRTGKQCTWFALDDRDTAVESIISALEMLLNGRETRLHPTQALFRGQPPLETRIDSLIGLVNHYPLPLTLFIDNINCCTDDALGPLLDKLVFQTKSSLQLVLSSTREIPVDVSRAQLQGLIRQIGLAELSFSTEEVGKLLGANLCHLIGHHGVEDVAQQTEGWPAAVRMAQIILSNTEHPQAALKVFSGSDEALAHLLNRQVLSVFPAEVRDFLLCIAQVRTFCLELCSHIIGSDRAKEYLAYLLDRNVFVIPLDRNRSWYRLHGLFREHLLREAQSALTATRRQEVLTRAAHWCEKNKYWRESVEYALASGSASTASKILEHIAPVFVRNSGLILQYIQWIELLHEQGHQAGPEAEYWFAWALAFHRRYDYARRQCANLAMRVQRQSKKDDGEKKKDLQRRISILRASIDSLSDHLQDAHIGASKWLAGAGAGMDDPFNLAAAYCIESGYFSRIFRFVEARSAIHSAREAAFQANSAYVDGWISSFSALISIYEGNYAAAYPELVAALASTKASLGDDAGICGTMAMVAAKCAAEMGLTEEAWQLFELGSRTSRTHGFLEAAACGLEAAVLLWTGNSNDRISLALLREVASAYAPRLSLMLSCYLIRRLLVLGRLDDARDEAERIGLEDDSTIEHQRPASRIAQLDALIEDTKIAFLIASGKWKPAELLIAEQTPRAKASNCAFRLVELALASATIALRTDQQLLAVRHITRAIRIAATHCIVRPFNDQAETLAAIVADTKVNAWGFARHEERLFFVDRCRSLTFPDQSLYDRLASVHEEEPHLATPLTSRELELLGYIDAGLSNQQIADGIDVSLTTVKWHLQNLYAKLCVKNRSAALAKARVLNLLPR
ncbi:LuxR C-terminal-related transcriptional regulator [Rhodoferax ferrireducens]|uniref:LuxR C-terminal-related transcriptional regulator n=1 Tax=Rhodoferax ferrireducens TaxID=192843 RepID=UPI000E0DB367|nr:LuxR C-terminal-related transcriptional regulator [Rhodoferax ferrireducens]